MSNRLDYDTVTVTLGSAVGAGGSFTASYPTGKSADDYVGGLDHTITSHSIRVLRALSNDFTIAFGASLITVTLATGLALANGSVLYLNLERADDR
jgi:ABC-type spermidine/putrescine transport system permease subunit II